MWSISIEKGVPKEQSTIFTRYYLVSDSSTECNTLGDYVQFYRYNPATGYLALSGLAMLHARSACMLTKILYQYIQVKLYLSYLRKTR